MKLSKETIKILENFSSINKNLLIRPGSTLSTIKPTTEAVYARVDIPEVFESKIGIYDISNLLGALRLFDDPELEVDTNSLVIREGNKHLKYHFASETVLIAPPENLVPDLVADVSFTVSAQEISFLEKMGNVLKLPERSISGDGRLLTLNALDSKNKDTNIQTVEVGNTTEFFNLIFKEENINLMPGDYEVGIIKKFRVARFKGPVEYFVKYEQNSTI